MDNRYVYYISYSMQGNISGIYTTTQNSELWQYGIFFTPINHTAMLNVEAQNETVGSSYENIS